MAALLKTCLLAQAFCLAEVLLGGWLGWPLLRVALTATGPLQHVMCISRLGHRNSVTRPILCMAKISLQGCHCLGAALLQFMYSTFASIHDHHHVKGILCSVSSPGAGCSRQACTDMGAGNLLEEPSTDSNLSVSLPASSISRTDACLAALLLLYTCISASACSQHAA